VKVYDQRNGRKKSDRHFTLGGKVGGGTIGGKRWGQGDESWTNRRILLMVFKKGRTSDTCSPRGINGKGARMPEAL